jgi:hypothetical protein
MIYGGITLLESTMEDKCLLGQGQLEYPCSLALEERGSSETIGKSRMLLEQE